MGVDDIGGMTPVIVAFLSYSALGLEGSIDEFDKPFRTSQNDFPLTATPRTIDRTLRERQALQPQSPAGVNHP